MTEMTDMTIEEELSITCEQRDALDIECARLEKEVEALRKDAERYRWLRKFYGSVNFEPEDHGGMDLVFMVPQGEVSADCDKTIDGLMRE